MKQYTSNALLVAGKPATIKSNVCTINTVEAGTLTGYCLRLQYSTVEESNSFQQKLREVLTLWGIPFSCYTSSVLDTWRMSITVVPTTYQDYLERILAMYYQVEFDF